MPPDTPTKKIRPRQLGPFTLEAELGRGGMGVVHRAYDPILERQVAIKAIAPEMARDEETLERFKREARLLAQLNHPHIAHVHQLLEHDGATYLVLEYVPGRSLDKMIARDGALPIDQALSLCLQITRAIEAAHERGIVHRDLKPQNVRVTDDGVVKVLDFGLALRSGARDATPGRATGVSSSGTAWRENAIQGTPGYMAPEQTRGQATDARADIFSFGCLLYECLAGHPAFTGESIDALMEATRASEPTWLDLPGAVPERIGDLLRACLAKAPADRLQRIGDARIAINASLGRTTTSLPSPAAQSATPNNLPSSVTSFVGRVNELRELRELLLRVRLLTLTGAGGCGKTRLALELARRAMRDFSSGVYLVELASTVDPAQVPAAVATALGVKERPGRTTLQSIVDRLAGRAVLLLMDNCEHVVVPVASFVSALLRTVPELRIIATSREVLGADGETTWLVPSLSLPESGSAESFAASESVALFQERARAVKPSFVPETDAPAVTRICRRLDGIPLAIELAAARVKLLSPAEIEQRLDDRFRLLTGGGRRTMERHRTLRAAVDWSYRMLSESEKRMFRALSVFTGGWSLEGAVAVCGPCGRETNGHDLDEFEVLDVLARLVEKSLVVVDIGPLASRYRLLETLRQYAIEKLVEANEAPTVRTRHLAFYRSLVEAAEPELTGAGQERSLARLEQEHENVIAALEHCAVAPNGAATALRLCQALMRFWLYHGHFHAGRTACLDALRHPGAVGPTVERAGALHAAAKMAEMLGAYEEADAANTEALDIRRELGDRAGVAASLTGLGNVAYYRGDLAEAERRHRESLTIDRELDNQAGIASSLNNLANVLHDSGRLADAREMYDAALAINRTTGNRAAEAINLNNLGLVASHANDLKDARRLHEKSLAIRRALGDDHGIAESLAHLGGVAGAQRDFADSERLHAESLAIRRDLGDRLGITDSLDEAAILAARLDLPERAAQFLGACERLRETIGAPRPAPDQNALDSHIAAIRTKLGPSRFESALETGRALSHDDAVEAAMAWLVL